MRNLRTLIGTAFLLGGMSLALAQANRMGPGEGGGGDPDVARFVHLGKKLAAYFRENPNQARLPFTAPAFSARITLIEESVRNQNAPDLVEFTTDKILDRNGQEKPADFHPVTKIIRVHRPYWHTADDQDRLILIAMEIGGLLEVDVRHEAARGLISGNVPLILSMFIDNEREETPIDWRMADQDANIFARMTTQDLIIDGGIVGTGSPTNERVARFLENPLQDQEWITLARTAFARRMNAYLMLRDQSGHRASITAIFEHRVPRGRSSPGVATYTLLFYADTRPAVGACRHDASELSALDRLKNCLFDRRHYTLFDAESSRPAVAENTSSLEEAWNKSFAKLNQTLIHHFSQSPHALREALRRNLIQDLSSLMPPPFSSPIMVATLRGNGQLATLSSAPDGTAFWTPHSESDAANRRLFLALEILARHQLGYFPGFAPRCIERQNADGSFESPPNRQAGIIRLSELRGLVRRYSCHEQPTFMESGLYRAMARYGFRYSSSEGQWRRSPAVIIYEDKTGLMLSSREFTRELEMRIVTEQMNSQQILALVHGALLGRNHQERAAIYADVYKNLSGLVDNQSQKLLYTVAFDDIFRTLQAHGLDAYAEDPLVRNFFDHVQPVLKFIEHSLKMALSDRLFDEDTSRNFLDRLFPSPIFRSYLASVFIEQHFSWRHPARAYPYFREGIEVIFDGNFFDPHLASTLTSAITRFDYQRFPDVPLVDWVDRYWIAQRLMLRPDLLSEEDLLQLRVFEPVFSLGRWLESHPGNRSPEAAARLLLALLPENRPGQSTTVAPLITHLLITREVAKEVRKPLIETLLQRLQQFSRLDQYRTDLARTHRDLMSLLQYRQLDRDEQDLIGQVLVTELTPRSAPERRRSRGMLQSNILYWGTPVQFYATQSVLEALAETAIAEPHDLVMRPEFEGQYSQAGDLLRLLAACKEERPNRNCQYVTSFESIYLRLADNMDLPDSIRSRARDAMGAR